MKRLFIGIFLLAITSIFSEGKSWDEPPKVGQLFMVITNILEEDNSDFYLIWRYKGSNPSFEEEFKEWYKVTPESVHKWLEDGKNVINIADSN